MFCDPVTLSDYRSLSGLNGFPIAGYDVRADANQNTPARGLSEASGKRWMLVR